MLSWGRVKIIFTRTFTQYALRMKVKLFFNRLNGSTFFFIVLLTPLPQIDQTESLNRPCTLAIERSELERETRSRGDRERQCVREIDNEKQTIHDGRAHVSSARFPLFVYGRFGFALSTCTPSRPIPRLHNNTLYNHHGSTRPRPVDRIRKLDFW